MKPSETAELEAIAESKEHIQKAEIANTASVRKPSYDTYEYSDNYFKLPQNERNEEFETIRKESQTLSSTDFLVTQAVEKEQYEGEIDKYYSTLETFEKSIAHYCRKYSTKLLDPEVLQIIDSVQKGVEIIEKDMFEHIGFNHERYKKEHVISISKEPYRTISEFEYTTREDMINRFGKSFLIYLEFRTMMSHVPRKLKEEVEREIKIQESFEKLADFRKEEDMLQLAVQDASTVLALPSSAFNPNTGLLYLQKRRLSYYFDSHPNFHRFKNIYEQSNIHVENELLSYYVKDASKLQTLDVNELTQVLSLALRRKDTDLIRVYVEMTDESQILSFLEKNLESYNPLDLSNTIFPYLEETSLSTKKEFIGQFYISQLPKILPRSLETNSIVFKTVAHFLHLQQKTGNPQYEQTISQIVDAIPNHIQFIQKHPQQMNTLLNFISWTFLEITQPGELTDENIKELESKFKVLDTGDRYHNIQNSFDQLMKRLKERPKPLRE